MKRLFLGCWIASLWAVQVLAATPSDRTLDPLAERFVKLALAVGVHDADYVDAYHGPAEWRAAAEAEKAPLAELMARGEGLAADLAAADPQSADELERLRFVYLTKQVRATNARMAILSGRTYTFDEESSLLFDAVAPAGDPDDFARNVKELERLIPGDGPLPQRVQAFRNRFVIPADRVDRVFQAAIAEARRRTLAHLPLPEGERFVVEYVRNQPWGGYNWYKGGYFSLIQVNVDLPTRMSAAIDLAVHEGYPGHHVYNSLLESNLLEARRWIEFSVMPLYSPQALIAEGSANYAIDVAFPRTERMAFECDVLYPLAGLDPAWVDDFYRFSDLMERIGAVSREVARRYVNGSLDETAARDWLKRYALMDDARAAQQIKFIARYRSYIINYSLGQEMVRDYVEARANGDPGKRWEVFKALLSSPRLPSGLR